MILALWAVPACFLAGIGARDQMVVAGLTARLGRHGGLLLAGMLTAALTSGLAAWAGGIIAAQTGPGARRMLACGALIAAGLAMGRHRPMVLPREPTRSLFAAMLVLAMRQVADAGRWLVLATALLVDRPLGAGVYGALGTGLALLAGWIAGEGLLRKEKRLYGARRWAGAIIAGVAIAGMAKGM